MSKASNSPTTPRGPVDHEVRQQIVVAATDHFRLYGYEKTTVSDLAKAIGFSKAYIYKFFESKQAIGELICGNCLDDIETAIRTAVASTDRPPEKLRQMFKTAVESSLRLFFENRKLYDIAAAAATEQWEAVRIFEQHIQLILQEILRQGRESEDFERKTPLDEATSAIYLVMRPYINPLFLRFSQEGIAEVPPRLSSLVLRSLSP
jgi:AcrR family transcriptional regulator